MPLSASRLEISVEYQNHLTFYPNEKEFGNKHSSLTILTVTSGQFSSPYLFQALDNGQRCVLQSNRGLRPGRTAVGRNQHFRV
jgi:hypothetical protein